MKIALQVVGNLKVREIAKGALQAEANAINHTLNKSRQMIRDAMKKDFKNPTPYTLNSVFVQYATTSKLVGTIEVKSKASGNNKAPVQHLIYQVEGGAREQKPAEKSISQLAKGARFAIPLPGAPINKYGFIPGATWKKILKDIKGPTHKAPVYFLAPKRPLVMVRTSAERKSAKPVLLLTSKRPQYRKRLMWEAIVQKVWSEYLPGYYREEMGKGILE